MSTLPTQQQDRVLIVDILRGFALFGVLMGNFNGFLTNYVPDSIIEAKATGFDHFLDYLHSIFIENKFMTLFSMLFGYGFGVIIERVSKRKLNTTYFFLRRMFWLFVFGCIHLLFWSGDILHIYAFAGIFLLLFRKASKRQLIIWTILFLFVLPTAIRTFQEYYVKFPDFNAIRQIFYETIKFGSLKDVAILNYSMYPKLWFTTYIELRDLSETLGRFLFGYLILRSQVLNQLDKNNLLIGRIWKVTLIGMLIYILLWVLNKNHLLNWKLMVYILLRIGVFCTALFYATSIILLYEKTKPAKWMNGFSYLGKMTLTNYLMETAVYVILFGHVGFGLLGDWSLTTIWIAAFILYFLQILFSRWWLSKFNYGLVEWIWRQLTYRQRFAIRKLKKD